MIISKTPFRVSFAGGGTDLSAYYKKRGFGAVLSTSIDKYMYITVHKPFEDYILLRYSSTELVNKVEEVKHPLIKEALKLLKIKNNIEITSFADIPSIGGTGLGSSSSYTIGLLNTLSAHLGKHFSKEKLAKSACDIEINKVGSPIGKQDQYAAAYGGLNFIKFNDDETVIVEPIIMDSEIKKKLNNRLVLFYTGITRSANEILIKQKKNTMNSQDHLNFLDKMKELAIELRKDLKNGKIDSFGQMLHKGWEYKKEMAAGITNVAIENLYNYGTKNGAEGGKLLGAGGGGFLLFYVLEKNKKKLIKTMTSKGVRYFPFNFENDGSRIIFQS